MAFPDKQTIDNWGVLGNQGWSFEDLLPYYRKFHNFHEPDAETKKHLALDYDEPQFHGTSGPVQVSYGRTQTEFTSAWPRTFEKLGRKTRADPQSGLAVGGLNVPGGLNPDGWTRSHAAVSYLTPEVRQRPNLHIITEALVEKVLFQENSSPIIANGVQYVDKEGKTQIAHARGEVILCGGAFNSPQILELSGIGSEDILDKFGISTKVHLPGVGTNLQDHVLFGSHWESRIPTLDQLRDPAVAGAAFQEYQEHKTGLCANGTWNLAFLPSSASEADRERLLGMMNERPPCSSSSPGRVKQDELVRQTLENPKSAAAGYLFIPISPSPNIAPFEISDEAKQAQFIAVWTSISHPFARGTCHISSSNARDAPAIDPQYCSHPADVELGVWHTQYLAKVFATEPLASLIKPDGLKIPANLDEILKDPNAAREHFTKTAATSYHPCGTCPMMREKDFGVVDARLRVYGVKGLRVVDASVFPLIPRGNI